VESLGVGSVGRNTVVNTTMLFPVRCSQMPRITTQVFAAKKSLDLSKKSIVPEGIPAIVENDGKPKLFLSRSTIKLAKLLWIPFRNLSRFYSTRPVFSASVVDLLSDYRKTSFCLQDGLSEWKGEGGLVFSHEQETLVGMLQMKKMKTCWELSSFVVHPRYQGKGYGKKMLKTTIESISDLPVCLRVQQDNPAQHLYNSVGFETECVSNGRYIMKYLE
jgi:ribosomal protein S18 acetylase RimI-like enzyme